jgi:uridine kinase
MTHTNYLKSLKRPLFIGIAGGTASGKSTLARVMLEILREEGAEIIHVDAYYKQNDHLDMSEREVLNYDHPDRLEFSLLEKHLEELYNCNFVKIPVYDYAQHNRSQDSLQIFPTRYIIVEGILAFYPDAIRKILDYSVFVDAPAALRLERRIIRDIRERGRTKESVLKQWSTTVEPMYKKFCQPTSETADLIVEGLGIDRKKANFVINHMKQDLNIIE